jgi:hypothetical protein
MVWHAGLAETRLEGKTQGDEGRTKCRNRRGQDRKSKMGGVWVCVRGDFDRAPGRFISSPACQQTDRIQLAFVHRSGWRRARREKKVTRASELDKPRPQPSPAQPSM